MAAFCRSIGVASFRQELGWFTVPHCSSSALFLRLVERSTASSGSTSAVSGRFGQLSLRSTLFEGLPSTFSVGEVQVVVEGSVAEVVDMDETGLGDDEVIGEVVRGVSDRVDIGVMILFIGLSVAVSLLLKASAANKDPLLS